MKIPQKVLDELSEGVPELTLPKIEHRCLDAVRLIFQFGSAQIYNSTDYHIEVHLTKRKRYFEDHYAPKPILVFRSL